MRTQSKPKQRVNSKSNEKKLKKSNSIVPLNKKLVPKSSKKPNTSEEIVSPKTISYKKSKIAFMLSN
jgi:hypothetical protein